jgi:hypothetical protein
MSADGAAIRDPTTELPIRAAETARPISRAQARANLTGMVVDGASPTTRPGRLAKIKGGRSATEHRKPLREIRPLGSGIVKPAQQQSAASLSSPSTLRRI